MGLHVFKGRTYDKEYFRLIERLLDSGVKDDAPRPVYADGTPAHSYRAFNDSITIKPGMLPLLESKQVYYRDAVRELLWMWQKQSNNVQELRDMGSKIWNEWELEDGTIGKTYGYQLGKKVDGTDMNQVEHLIDQLKHNKDSRRHITTMWSVEEGHEMALKPCVYTTQWVVLGDVLHVHVLARSTDVALGLPYDIVQYWTLLQLIAQETGYVAGDMKFEMVIPHYYDRHVDELNDQLDFDLSERNDFELHLNVAETNVLQSFHSTDIQTKNYKQQKRSFEIAE